MHYQTYFFLRGSIIYHFLVRPPSKCCMCVVAAKGQRYDNHHLIGAAAGVVRFGLMYSDAQRHMHIVSPSDPVRRLCRDRPTDRSPSVCSGARLPAPHGLRPRACGPPARSAQPLDMRAIFTRWRNRSSAELSGKCGGHKAGDCGTDADVAGWNQTKPMSNQARADVNECLSCRTRPSQRTYVSAVCLGIAHMNST